MKNNFQICFLIPLYGKEPVYINLFLKSAEFNKDYKFLFITDLEMKWRLPENVEKINCSLDDFKKLIYMKTRITPDFKNYYKIVDFKPAYGLIFQEYISEPYWGILDVDLILGDIKKFITPELLNNFEIISVRKYWLSGSFAIFKNCYDVNNLFKKSNDWEEVFSSSRLYRFCETGTQKNTDNTLLNELRAGIPIHKIVGKIVSYTHVLKNDALLNGIRVHFGDLVKESINKKMILGYKSGRVFIQNPGKSDFQRNKDFLHYHFVSEKSKLTFAYPGWKDIPDEFYITEYGFLKKDELKLYKLNILLRIIKSYFYFISIKIPIKIARKLLK